MKPPPSDSASKIVCRRSRLMSAILVTACLAWVSPLGGQTLKGTLTADNAYQLWAGSGDSVLEQIVGDENCEASEISDAESFTFDVPQEATHLYLVAYSDDGVAQGVLGELTFDGRTVFTGDAGWEVFATGNDRDLSCAAGFNPPTAAEVDAEITRANGGNGAPGATSRTWVDLQGGGAGFLAVGQANQQTPGGLLVVDDVDPRARWMWYRPPGVANAFHPGADHREYLIFRLPLSALQTCTRRPGNRIEWFPLDETAPDVAHEVILGRNGRWRGGPVPVPGRVGGALSFPGDSDWVESANGGFPGNSSSDMTFDLWLRTDPASGTRSLLDSRQDPASPRGYQLFLSNGRPGLQLATGNGSNVCGPPPGAACTNWVTDVRVDDGEWHFLAVSVDRDSSTGLRFYVDGDLVGTFDPTGRQGNLFLSAPLRIGRNAAGFLAADYDGTLDEIEIIPEALSEAEIDRIYRAGRAGKCKETLTVPWDARLCENAQFASTTIAVCNDSGTPQSYDLSFTPLAPQDRPLRCDVPGPTGFTVQGGLPFSVPERECRGVKVRIRRAPDLTAHGQVACYQAALRNLDTGAVLIADGSIWDQRDVCPDTKRPVDVLTRVFPTSIVYDFQSSEPVAAVPFRVEVVGPDMEPDTEVVSLDGQPPGEPLLGQLSLEPGEPAWLSIDATAVEEPIGSFYQVVFSADTDGDGEDDTVSSAALRVSAEPCRDGLGALCLNDDRFKVQVRWTDFTGRSGTGEAVPLTGDTGYLWFFDDANVELIVKVLDGRALNGNWWVFYGALSNVEFEITVTDTATGATRTYLNPPGQFASVGDIEAFPGESPDGAPSHRVVDAAEIPAADLARDLFAFSDAGAPPAAAAPRQDGGCRPDPGNLCLNMDRFRVETTWTDFEGNSGTGTAVPLTTDTGYFWFFSQSNVELVLKVLDGRPINGHFWVFYGALSNVEYRITVTDTVTGAVKTYSNPAGNFASVGDTQAFEVP